MATTNWYWIDGTAYCPACVECDTPAIDVDVATRGPCEHGRCGCCGRDAGDLHVEVTVGHRSGIAGARWCRPVGWSPRNRIEGADWSDEGGAWLTEAGEAAGIVVFGHDESEDGDSVTVKVDDLRVAKSGECRVIDEVDVVFS